MQYSDLLNGLDSLLEEGVTAHGEWVGFEHVSILDLPVEGTHQLYYENNIDEDPLFVDPANQDYHLSSSSPCLSTGSPVEYPAVDLEGHSRPYPAMTPVDMGVYEDFEQKKSR